MKVSFIEYRNRVLETLEVKTPSKKVLILGLISEIGSVQSCIKKILRDRKTSASIENVDKESLETELGDVLWYIDAICYKYNFNISEILLTNLARIKNDHTVILKDYPNISHLDLTHLKKISIPKTINDFDSYQNLAAKTNLIEGGKAKVSFEYCYLFNLVGHEIYKFFISKKQLRNNELPNRLGDLCWYVSALAKYYGISLNEVAVRNMAKVEKLFLKDTASTLGESLFDENRESAEQLPREMVVYFYDQSSKMSYITINSILLGDPLDDNYEEDDGYRYHDGIHFVIYALLGWSPVWRSFLRRKRKKKIPGEENFDGAQDGARAKIVEEMIVKLIHSYFKGIEGDIKKGSVNSSLLKAIEILTKGLEVKDVTFAQWEEVIIESQKIYNQLWDNNGGKLFIDMNKKEIKYRALRKKEYKFKNYG